MSKDEEEAQTRGFKVSDRRRFVDGGESAETAARADERAQPEPAPAAPPPDPLGVESPAGHPGEPMPEMSFSTFVISLTTQALMHLGEIADPQVPQITRDLPAAKQMIDLLGILNDKTKGNLDPAEEQLLGDMLYDLRMRYVEVARGR